MSIRLNSSSRPGMTDSSSASTASTPPQLSRLTTYSWISRQLASSRAWLSICSAQSRSASWRGSGPRSASEEAAGGGAGALARLAPQRAVEGAGGGVGRVGGHHQGGVPAGRGLGGGGRGNGGLAHAALAGEQEDAHGAGSRSGAQAG